MSKSYGFSSFLASRFYDLFMLPLEASGIRRLRRELIPRAAGRILELGAGTGVNLKYYDYSKIDSLTVSDHTPGRLLQRRASRRGVEILEADVMELPWGDESFDTVVFTLLFCSVEDPAAGLAEIKRVLKPDGQIIFLEHVLGCGDRVRKIQHLLTPFWRRISGNCHLNRDTLSVIEAAGFRVERTFRRAGCVLTAGIARS